MNLIPTFEILRKIPAKNIQRRFTKRVPSFSHLYLERLRALELEPLELRRLEFDLIQYYTVLNNFTCIQPNSHFHLHYPPPSSRTSQTCSGIRFSYSSPFLQKSQNFNKNSNLHSTFRYFDWWNALTLMYNSHLQLITSSRPQRVWSGLCNFAQVIPFSCPFEIGLWLCCVRFSAAISPWVSWSCAECVVPHLSWSSQNITRFKPTRGREWTEASELGLL